MTRRQKFGWSIVGSCLGVLLAGLFLTDGWFAFVVLGFVAVLMLGVWLVDS